MRAFACLSLLALTGCAAGEGNIAVLQPAAGANEVFEGPVAAAPGHSLVMGDLLLPANGAIARHRHAGEEFLYVLGGSAVVSREGEADVTLAPGQAIRIAPGVVHWGRAGPAGVRAVASWIKVDGQPLREAVPE